MRRQLIAGAAAVTATVVIAFLLPLAIVVRDVAADRAYSDAESVVRAAAPLVAVSTDHRAMRSLFADVTEGVELTAYFPDGTVLGPGGPEDGLVRRARAGSGFRTAADGLAQVILPVLAADGQTVVLRATLPPGALWTGVGRAWAMLAGVGLGLLVLAVIVADRLARTVVVPTRQLAVVAGRLGSGDLAARFDAGGPAELREVGEALNLLAKRMDELLAAERELVADLSHRLRTPLTALRLDVEAAVGPEHEDRLLADVDAVAAAVDGLIREARAPRESGSVVDLVAVVHDRVAFWAPLAEDQGRRWQVHAPAGPLPIAVGRSELAAAFDVVVQNVFAHTAEGVGCTIVAEPRADGAALIVEDEGSGFTRLQRVERGVSGTSTGLGLDIARRLAESTGGALLVDNVSSGGTRVELRFGWLAEGGRPETAAPFR
jgi:signal transduction histidine kinase